MADDGKVLINLTAGLEDQERVTIAFLVATAAQGAGKTVAMWLTKEAVRLATPGYGTGVACEGCPPLVRGAASRLTRPASRGTLWRWPSCRAAPSLSSSRTSRARRGC